jgi:hypothetical protein
VHAVRAGSPLHLLQPPTGAAELLDADRRRVDQHAIRRERLASTRVRDAGRRIHEDGALGEKGRRRRRPRQDGETGEAAGLMPPVLSERRVERRPGTHDRASRAELPHDGGCARGLRVAEHLELAPGRQRSDARDGGEAPERAEVHARLGRVRHPARRARASDITHPSSR